MTSPNVTATISAVDNASPVVRELLANLKKAEQLAKQAFDSNATGNLARGLNQANVAAEKHLGLLGRIHSAHKMIAASVAGYAGLRMVHGGVDAIKHALPYLREDVAIKARTGYSEADMVALRKQQNELASVYGATVEATQKAHETFGRLKYDAATNLAITRPTAIGAKAMGVTPEQNAELMESMISQYGVHFDSPADAQAKATRLNDLAAVATKKSNMTFEDVKEFTKYSAAAANAAGVSPEVNLAMGMALRRGGIVGAEGGVFARQFYARELAPTRKGREVLAQNGINIDDYATHGAITGEGLSDKLARNFGKRLSKEAVAGFNSQLEDHGDEILSDRGKFTEMVRKAAEASGDKLSKTDQKNLARAANEYFDFTKQGFKGEALLNRIIAAGNPMLMQAFLGDKQGARGIALLQEHDKFDEAKRDLGHADGFAKKVADEMNAGLASAVDRLTASAEALSHTMVKANEGWLTGVVDAANAVTTALTNLSPEAQRAAGIFAGIATVAAGGGLAYSMVTFIGSVNSASAALQVLAGRAAVPAVPGVPSGAPGVIAPAVVGGTVAASFGVSTALATAVGLYFQEKSIRTSTDEQLDSNIADWADPDWAVANAIEKQRRQKRRVWDDMPAPQSGPFDKFQRPTLDDVSSRYLRSGGDGGVTSGGWQDSIRNVGQSSGFKDVAVTGTVSGATDLAINVSGDIKPTPYLEGIIHRAEANASISLSGYLGTSMQGPGDNATKASVGAFPSGGHH
ncbi:phage tail tape measure protein [Bradyrhizobium sp. BRP56]|uniref:phage tail tape measure protein n=1 Tax=Bradyrhizobium sp. BRP56 TaxID=2793819 RepID=UPI001CD42BA9|nr:phage tail tape measure protein [Bradyrhizobium sp. BRP56]MCA1401933.1 phage tail tape measure protein [Bradyrhizobium sp. BRP56]